MSRNIPEVVQKAIKCGPIPKMRNWRRVKLENRTRAELAMTFIETYCKTPEGKHVGKPIKLAPFQEAFIYAIYDNPHKTRRAILSIGRKNGKTALSAAILLLHIIGREATQNSQMIAAALSKEQASLVFKLAHKMLMQSPELMDLVKVIPSQKIMTGLHKNVEFKAIAKDSSGGSTMGLSPVCILVDESGQVLGTNDPFIESLTTSQAAHEDPLYITISTQSPSDADYLSALIDDSITSQDPHTVTHVYAAEEKCDLMDKEQWKYANPALGIFRQLPDLEDQLKQAVRLPAKEASVRNLLLNQRVAQEQLFISASVWKENSSEPDLSLFQNPNNIVGMSLDLSARNDLTAACIAVCDPRNGHVHVIPFVFCPTQGIEDRSRRDRTPYDVWVKNGSMIPIGGNSMDYDQIAVYLRDELEHLGIALRTISFDRWRMDILEKSFESIGAFQGVERVPVGQGFQSQSPSLENMESLLLEKKIHHGNHPLLTMAASNAIAVRDPTNAVKIDKKKSTARIDPIIAMHQAVHLVSDGLNVEPEIDISALVG